MTNVTAEHSRYLCIGCSSSFRARYISFLADLVDLPNILLGCRSCLYVDLFLHLQLFSVYCTDYALRP